MQTIKMNIPLGYWLRAEKHTKSVEEARAMLITRRQESYTLAERDDYRVELTRHYIQCPRCNYKIYSYARYLNRLQGCRHYVERRAAKSTVLNWTSQQLTFFPEERKPLHLNRPIRPVAELVCPKCQNTMHRSYRTRRVELQRHRHKISMRVEVLDITELFSAPCLNGTDIRVEFPLFEVAVFNFSNGHCYLRLETPEGRCLAVRDMTTEKNRWNSGAAHSVITQNKYVRRALRDLFCAEWGGAIPFYPSEIGVHELRMLTRFIGYDRAFYSSIPFAEQSLEVDESFKADARRLRKSQWAVALYEGSGLPNVKSVRRTFFDHAGLFFYLKECLQLWQLLQDPNYFVRFLQNERLYQVLSDLHTRPMIFEFFRDYVAKRGGKRLLRLLQYYWSSTCRYAIDYSSMSTYKKKSEQQRWATGKKGDRPGAMPSFAIPMRTPDECIRNVTIDGFEFYWLKTSVDYKEAGEALHNCIRYWYVDDPAIVAVRQNGKIVAAIEAGGKIIYQAYSAENCPLSRVPGLLEAFNKWKIKNNLQDHSSGARDRRYVEDPLEDEEEEEDFIPF